MQYQFSFLDFKSLSSRRMNQGHSVYYIRFEPIDYNGHSRLLCVDLELFFTNWARVEEIHQYQASFYLVY